MEKINIAELLRDCPKGMELYSPIFGEVYLDEIRPHLAIVVTTDKEQGDFKEEFLYDGRYGMNGECMLFPSKGKTTWEGFVPPCKFKDGDIIFAQYYDLKYVSIVKQIDKSSNIHVYCLYGFTNSVFAIDEILGSLTESFKIRFATKEEKRKLFDAIKANGYKWNAETKTLEELITPRFKVGDRVKYRSGEIVYRIVQITEDSYVFDNLSSIPISIEHMYNLVPNKFDIATLKPFDKVLVRDTKKQVWVADLFSHFVNRPLGGYTFACVGHYPSQCIPYEGNEHLLGTTDDCDDFYKTWEE